MTLGLILWKEMNPAWKRHQEQFYREERGRLTIELQHADEVQRGRLERRLRDLRRPQYGIRQILIKEVGGAERCITCHLDLKRLEHKHPEIARYPFEEYGCTVCHGGVGRATEARRAHSTLRIPRRPLFEYLQALGSESSALDLFRYNASGEQIPYTGSKLCLRCHLSSHPRHVARWRRLKFKPLDAVKSKLEEVKRGGLVLEDSKCLGCHTTGYRSGTGRYLEGRVTCESCHGPGGFYADLMAGGRARDGAELARANILGTRADQVCLNCHRPDRHKDFEREDLPPTLVAAYLDGKPAPEMDGEALDDAWAVALETKVLTWRLKNGPPQPGTEIFIRAVYNDTHIYFAFRWSDKTRHDRMGQWVYSGGRWRAEMDWPDALALHWQAAARVDDFGQGGCAVLCHSTGRFREFPRMATREEGAVADEWYWNAFTAERAGRPGDGFLDHQIRFIPKGAPKAPLRWANPEISAAHGSDASGARMPGTVGGIALILNAEETDGEPPIPRLTSDRGRQGRSQLSNSSEPEERILPLYETGTPEGGDSADILGRGAWADGYWTLELGRPLRTPSKRDVQLDPSAKGYSFGLAVWDGAGGDRHQVATLIKLRFEPVLGVR